MKKLIFVLISFLMLACFLSCSKKNNNKYEAEFVFVCTMQENEYWQNCFRGIEQADKELNTHTTIMAPQTGENFAVEILTHIANAVNQKSDGIMTYAGIEDMYPYIDLAYEQGTPIIAVDSDAPSTKRLAFVGTDPYDSGYQGGEKMVALTGGKAKIGVLISSMSAEKEVLQMNAFKDAIMDFDMEIVAIEETDVDYEISIQKTKKMLAEHPEINAIFNTSSLNVTGAAAVKKEKNLKNLKLLGFDDTQENIELVKEGIIDALIVQNPKQMGYQAVYVLKEYLDKGVLLKTKFPTPVIMVTKENVDTYRK